MSAVPDVTTETVADHMREWHNCPHNYENCGTITAHDCDHADDPEWSGMREHTH